MYVDIRAACCMLCVTMTIVYWSRNSAISSSIFAVAIGSRADVGSSKRMISGLGQAYERCTDAAADRRTDHKPIDGGGPLLHSRERHPGEPAQPAHQAGLSLRYREPADPPPRSRKLTLERGSVSGKPSRCATGSGSDRFRSRPDFVFLAAVRSHLHTGCPDKDRACD